MVKLPGIFLCLITLIINLLSVVLFFKDPELQEMQGKRLGKINRGQLIYAVVFVVFNLVLILVLQNIYAHENSLVALKRIAVLALLWPIGYIDFKTYRIPNKFIIYGLCLRVGILVAEILFTRKLVLGNLMSEGIAMGAMLLVTILCAICMKGSIGYGDIKLFATMGLLLGMEGIWNAVFLSLIATFVVSVILMITKKKGRKDVVPFGPFIMIGTYLSIILTGM